MWVDVTQTLKGFCKNCIRQIILIFIFELSDLSCGSSSVRVQNIRTQLICILATFALTRCTTPVPPQNDSTSVICRHDSFIFSYWPSVFDSTVLPLTFYIQGLFYWLIICNLTRLFEVYLSILDVNKSFLATKHDFADFTNLLQIVWLLVVNDIHLVYF